MCKIYKQKTIRGCGHRELENTTDRCGEPDCDGLTFEWIPSDDVVRRPRSKCTRRSECEWEPPPPPYPVESEPERFPDDGEGYLGVRRIEYGANTEAN